jgi:hypothetical protein
MKYPDGPATPPLLVSDRGGVYLQAGSSFWMIRFRYKGRLIRESSRLTSKRDATAYLKRRRAEFGIGQDQSAADIPTLGEAADALLTHISAASKRGYPQVRAHLKNLVAHFGAETRIAEILPERMDRFVISRRAAGLKDSSVYNEMSTLRRCLRLQWKRHRLLALPEFPMPTRGKARQGFLTLEEVERICRHLPPHGANAVHFAWETGWRRGEIFGLRWQDVDWRESSSCRIRRTVSHGSFRSPRARCWRASFASSARVLPASNCSVASASITSSIMQAADSRKGCAAAGARHAAEPAFRDASFTTFAGVSSSAARTSMWRAAAR